MIVLFIVPCPCAGTASGAKPEKAARAASAMRLLVSTFPATTAAGYLAFTRLPSGASISRGA
jgi:hypothetical protein